MRQPLQTSSPAHTTVNCVNEQEFFPEDTPSNEFAAFIESLDKEGFNDVLKSIPEDIVKRTAAEFTEYDKVGVADFN